MNFLKELLFSARDVVQAGKKGDPENELEVQKKRLKHKRHKE